MLHQFLLICSNVVVLQYFSYFRSTSGKGKIRVYSKFSHLVLVNVSNHNKSVKPIWYNFSFLFCTSFIGISVNPGELGSRNKEKEGRKPVISPNGVLTGV